MVVDEKSNFREKQLQKALAVMSSATEVSIQLSLSPLSLVFVCMYL